MRILFRIIRTKHEAGCEAKWVIPICNISCHTLEVHLYLIYYVSENCSHEAVGIEKFEKSTAGSAATTFWTCCSCAFFKFFNFHPPQASYPCSVLIFWPKFLGKLTVTYTVLWVDSSGTWWRTARFVRSPKDPRPWAPITFLWDFFCKKVCELAPLEGYGGSRGTSNPFIQTKCQL